MQMTCPTCQSTNIFYTHYPSNSYKCGGCGCEWESTKSNECKNCGNTDCICPEPGRAGGGWDEMLGREKIKNFIPPDLITPRDLFAAAAMQYCWQIHTNQGVPWPQEDKAEYCFEIADSMMAERNKSKNEKL